MKALLFGSQDGRRRGGQIAAADQAAARIQRRDYLTRQSADREALLDPDSRFSPDRDRLSSDLGDGGSWRQANGGDE